MSERKPQRVRGLVEYDGTAYFGFQVQRREPTVQRELERAIESVTGEAVQVVGSGRTDAGVHALGQVIHFDTSWGRSLGELERALNAVLPRDIAVRDLEQAPEGFHARFSATSRTYCYTIWNGRVRSPMQERYAHHVHEPLDVARMDAACRIILGSHDFRAFGAPTRPGGSTVRQVYRACAWRDGDLVLVEVEANGFLRRMMRRLVGTLVEVGAGRLTGADVERLLRLADPAQVKWSLPPNGLCLVKVTYGGSGEDLFDEAERHRA